MALVDQIEATPLPYYFCWTEAVFDEHGTSYQLDPASLICVQVEGLTKQSADTILGAAVYDLQDELLDYDPDYDRFFGSCLALPVSELDFILLHRYVQCNFCPKHLSELFPRFPWKDISKKFDLELQDDRRTQIMNDLKTEAGQHSLRIQHLSDFQTTGDQFLLNVIKCSELDETGKLDGTSNNSPTTIIHQELAQLLRDFSIATNEKKTGSTKSDNDEHTPEERDAALKIARTYLASNPNAPNTQIASHVASHKGFDWFQSFHLTRWDEDTFAYKNRKKKRDNEVRENCGTYRQSDDAGNPTCKDNPLDRLVWQEEHKVFFQENGIKENTSDEEFMELLSTDEKLQKKYMAYSRKLKPPKEKMPTITREEIQAMQRDEKRSKEIR